MARKSIQDLAPEILAVVLTNLHPRDIISAQLVSRFWNDLVKHSADIQYIVELWRDGLIRGNDGGLTSAECLARLYARREAWRNLKWSSKSTVSMQSLESCRAYALSGGVFAVRGLSDEDRLDVLPLARLRDGADPNEAKTTSALGIPVERFQGLALDPGQDLLVILHILSASQGALDLRRLSAPHVPHPCAQLAMIQFEWNSTFDGAHMVALQILDDLVTLYLRDVSQLLIFDWRKGVMVLSLVHHLALWRVSKKIKLGQLFDQDEKYRGLGVVDYHFLSPRSFILACRYSGDTRFGHGSIQLYTLPEQLESSAVITHVASLDLPRVNAACPIVTIDILAGPLISRATPTPEADKPFYQSNDRRIVSFLILYARTNRFRLVMRIRTLRSLVKQHRRRSPAITITKTWDEWGPSQTRMFRGFEHSSFRARHVHGEWIALPSSWSGCCMRLLDFNVSPSVDSRSSDDQGDILHTAPSELQLIVDGHLPNPNPNSADPDSTLAFGFHLFKDPVCTSLPYREIQRDIDPGAGAYYSDDDDLGLEYVFLLDEDHVIAVDTNLDFEMVVLRMS
ncbi:hypothetical protein C8F01DRAFT_1379364 [Mycena amicta]|nr:hypothetical protein C8F01DRAFT_1379364 [Mycena amicta]